MNRPDNWSALDEEGAARAEHREDAERIAILTAERDAALKDAREQKGWRELSDDAHNAIRILLEENGVPVAAFIDDHVGNAIWQRNMARKWAAAWRRSAWNWRNNAKKTKSSWNESDLRLRRVLFIAQEAADVAETRLAMAQEQINIAAGIVRYAREHLLSVGFSPYDAFLKLDEVLTANTEMTEENEK